VVTVATQGGDYNFEVAGATVGETDFSLAADGQSGTVLTRAAMGFLRPGVSGVSVGGWEGVLVTAGGGGAVGWRDVVVGGVQERALGVQRDCFVLAFGSQGW